MGMNKTKSNIKKLNGFRNLKRNWDSYGARKLYKGVIDKSIEIIKKLDIQPFVAPCCNGNIMFEWDFKDGGYDSYISLDIKRNKIEILHMKGFFSIASRENEINENEINDYIRKYIKEPK